MKIPEHVLKELLGRLFLPPTDMMKCCLNIEKAHWVYLDKICSEDQQMKKVKFEEFAFQSFDFVPFLRFKDLNKILREFTLYKKTIPTCGAILLSPGRTHVLLLQSCFSKGLWGFPKGKLEDNESPVQCAIREVYEETGLRIKKLINPKSKIEGEWSNSSETGSTTLYVVTNVPKETKLAARTNGEIERCKWVPLNELFDAEKGADGIGCFKVTAHAHAMKKRLRSFLDEKMEKTQFRTNFRDQRSDRHHYIKC